MCSSQTYVAFSLSPAPVLNLVGTSITEMIGKFAKILYLSIYEMTIYTLGCLTANVSVEKAERTFSRSLLMPFLIDIALT